MDASFDATIDLWLLHLRTQLNGHEAAFNFVGVWGRIGFDLF